MSILRRAAKAAPKVARALRKLPERTPGPDWLEIDSIIKPRPGRTSLPREVRFRTARPFEPVLMDIEEATGIPVKTGFFDPLEKVKLRQVTASREWDDKAAPIFAFTRGSRRKLMGDYLMGAPAERAAAANMLTANEVERVRRLKNNIFDPLFKQWFGKDSTHFFSDIIPRHRVANTTDTRRLFSAGGAPSEVEMLQLIGQSAMINPLERDIARMTAGIIRTGFWRKHVDATYREAGKFLFSKALPDDLRPMLRKYLFGLEGEDVLVRNLGRVYQKFFRLTGHDVPEEDVKNIITTWMSLTHAGLLGLRPAPLLRNMFAGPTVTAPRIGNKWFLEGSRLSLTKRGFEEFKASGIMNEQATILDKLNAVSSGPVSKASQNVARTLLRPYSYADLVPRAQAYHGMKAKALDAIRRMPAEALRSKDTNKYDNLFLSRSGMYRFHPVHQRQVRDLWRAGKFEEAAHRAGIVGQQDTQWVYRQGFRPQILTSETGRLLGQFGIWPINYMEYFGQMARMLAYPEKWGIVPGYANAVRAEGMRWLGEWIVNNSAVIGAIGTTGAALGLGSEAAWHTSGWIVGGPAFSGGPALDLLMSLDGMIYEMSVGRPGQAMSEFFRRSENLLPGFGFVKDIAKSKGISVRAIPPRIGKSRTVKPSRSPAEQAFRIMTGVQRRK